MRIRRLLSFLLTLAMVTAFIPAASPPAAADIPFVPVTDITLDSPGTVSVGVPLQLLGTVAPANATYNDIVWSVEDSGGTGASLAGSMLTATSPGTVMVQATVTNGKGDTDYFKSFMIQVTPPFVPVTAITGVPNTATAGTPLTLSGTVAPANATNKTIVWSVADAGVTNAAISDTSLNTTMAGTVIIRASIANGLAAGAFERDFMITVAAGAKTVSVGEQSGTLVAGTVGTVTFPVTTTNIAAGTYPATVGSAGLPAGVSVQGQGQVTIAANGRGTLTLAGTAATAANSTAHRLTVDGATSAAQFTLTIAAANKTVSVGAQSGTLIAGTAGTVTFPVTTTNIAAGTYPATVTNRPTGVSVQGNVTINSGGTGTLVLSGTASTVAGTTSSLRLTIDGILSAAFSITITNTGDQAIANAIYNWLTWDRIRANNAENPSGGRFQVTSDLDLQFGVPSSNRYLTAAGAGHSSSGSGRFDTNGFTIIWDVVGGISSATINTNTGVVTFPPSDSRNVTLTATVRRGNTSFGNTNDNPVSRTSPFSITIQSLNPAITNVKDRLRWHSPDSNSETSTTAAWGIRAGNEGTNNNASRFDVTGDLDLPVTMRSSSATGSETVYITWAATPADIIVTSGANRGRVNPQSTNTNVTLTASFRLGSSTGAVFDTKQFPLRVMAGNDQEITTAIRRWLTWQRIRGNNALEASGNRYQVTSNLILPSRPPARLTSDGHEAGSGGIAIPTAFTITWAADPSDSISNTGAVTFPGFGSQNVTLTATIRKNNSTLPSNIDNRTREFSLTILQTSADQVAVNAAMNWLTWNQIRRHNDVNNSAAGPYLTMSHLHLPASHTLPDNRTVMIAWHTDNANRVAADGVVNPSSQETEVTLTARFTHGSIQNNSFENNPNTKTFVLTVRRPNDREAVEMARDALTWEVIRNRNTAQNTVSTNLTLPTEWENDTTVTWSTDDITGIITTSGNNIGRVTLPSSGNFSLRLTATISRGNRSETKRFDLSRIVFAVTENAGGASAALSAASFNNMTNHGTTGFDLEMDICDITFDAAAARAILGSSVIGDITINVLRVEHSTMTPVMSAAAGGRPVYRFSVLSGGRVVSDFDGGAATVRIPYTRGIGEDANAILVYFINTDGELDVIRGYYHNGHVIFTTGHFSMFTVAYNPVRFADDAEIPAWARGNITFTAARDLFAGNQAGSFMPKMNLSYAQLAAVLANYMGLSHELTVWPADHIAWGIRRGIFGNLNVDYTKDCSRAEMAYIIYNFIRAEGIKVQPVGDASVFNDIGGVEKHLADAIIALASWGIVRGTGAGFNPGGTITREEVASIIANIVRAFGT
jgi:hypothetical protein